MGAKPSWTSEIYLIQGVFRPQQVLSPPWKEKKIEAPLGQIPEYAPVQGNISPTVKMVFIYKNEGESIHPKLATLHFYLQKHLHAYAMLSIIKYQCQLLFVQVREDLKSRGRDCATELLFVPQILPHLTKEISIIWKKLIKLN